MPPRAIYKGYLRNSNYRCLLLDRYHRIIISKIFLIGPVQPMKNTITPCHAPMVTYVLEKRR